MNRREILKSIIAAPVALLESSAPRSPPKIHEPGALSMTQGMVDDRVVEIGGDLLTGTGVDEPAGYVRVVATISGDRGATFAIERSDDRSFPRGSSTRTSL